METVAINENIRVGVAFDNQKVFPVWFRWRNRYYKVRAVSFTWNSSQGFEKLHHYSVTDGANTYELCFNAHTLQWTLGKVHAG